MKTTERQYALTDLLYLMDRLRHPDTGCPWDLQQTFQSIVPHTLEEAYEVADAIEKHEYGHLKEELGDLLFQVVFYSRLAKEENLYSFDDVIDELVKKLIRRHPHVFPDGLLESSFTPETEGTPSIENVKKNWEVIKKAEKTSAKLNPETKRSSVLDDIPLYYPGLSRAEKLQSRAASIGFDWPDKEPVFAQLVSEVDELREELKLEKVLELNSNAQSAEAQSSGEAKLESLNDRIADELGDVMFSTVNLARHYGLDAEQVMRKANQKFENRFRIVERCIDDSGNPPESFDLDELESFWLKAKSELKDSS